MKFVLVVLVSLAVFSGCSKSSKSGGSLSGTFFYSVPSEPGDINPLSANDLVTTIMTKQQDYYISNVFETLLTKDLDTWEMKPNLAERWEISKDGKEFTFYLRKNVKFHDGSMMTAEDVKFSYDAIFKDVYEAFVLRSFYSDFESPTIIDKHTIKFKAKTSYFQNLLILGELYIVPKATYSKQTNENRLRKVAVGSGAYVLKKWDKGKSITIEKNLDWWGLEDEELKKRYNFDRIVFKFVKEATLTRAMLERGKLDYAGVRAEDFVKKMKGSPWGESVLKVKAENKVPKSMSYIGWNNNHKIFKDRDVRRAMSHLVNRAFINKKFYYGMSNLATGPFRVQSDYANPNTKPVEFDSAKAIQLLSKAGWSDTDKDGFLDKVIDGVKTKLSFNLISSSKDSEKMLTVIKEDMQKAGVEMVINTIDWNALVKAKNEKKFDAIIMAWGGGFVDPDPNQIWHSRSSEGIGSNYINYKNPKVDMLIDSARQILDKKKRIKAYNRIHEMIAHDTPYTFLFEPKYQLYAVSKRVARPKDTFVYSIGPQMWSLPVE